MCVFDEELRLTRKGILKAASQIIDKSLQQWAEIKREIHFSHLQNGKNRHKRGEILGLSIYIYN